MKPFAIVSTLCIALSLAACGSKDQANNSSASAAPVEGAAPPAGKKWSEVVSVSPEGGFVMGNPNASVKVVEFGSFTCSHCKEFSETSTAERNALVDTGKLTFEYRTFVRDPLDISAAMLARCNGPEAFFPLAEQLFINQTDMITKVQGMGETAYGAAINKPLNERFIALAQAAGLIDFAKQRGVPEAKAKQCLADGAKVEAIVKQVQADTATYNIEGTPTIVLNGQVVPEGGSWPAMRAKLKEAGI